MSKQSTKHKADLSKHKINVLGQSFEVDLDFSELGAKLDIAQNALDAQVWADVQKYMPFDTGALISETNMLNGTAEAGTVYCSPDLQAHAYAHYVYEGELYVDPKTNKGAFYNPNYGFWSRPGVAKVPSGRPLNYSKPTAVAHWDEAAINNHLSSWVDVVKRALE